ncbi:MAG: uroporphyrinogen-III C-methyltransferase, partial [Lachnospiraceae bacterium]|nr:uroporphyrinogen-III C-methyltransferase [Lachnospiraceae bacterium]
MGYFPFFMDIEGKSGLIVGGGEVARRKVLKLMPFQPKLTVVAPVIARGLLADKALTCVQRAFREYDILGQMFVIAASDEADVNQEVGRLCREMNIPVNVADEKEACSFLFPALVKEGRLTIGISTEGASPAMAGKIRSSVEASLPHRIGEELERLANLREQVKKEIPAGEHRTEVLKQAAQNYADGTCRMTGQEKGKVILTGAGCGAYDLITVRGMNAVRDAQVLVYDDLIDERLLSHAGESCEKIYVGKRSGKHSMPQEEINALLIAKAKEGKLVVRLKGGDPFVFGRGGEEILALRQAGIEVEEIPGISSAVAVPSASGITVTHRV